MMMMVCLLLNLEAEESGVRIDEGEALREPNLNGWTHLVNG